MSTTCGPRATSKLPSFTTIGSEIAGDETLPEMYEIAEDETSPADDLEHLKWKRKEKLVL